MYAFSSFPILSAADCWGIAQARISCWCYLVFATNITKLYSVQVDGMDVLAVKQACKFAKEHAVANGPIVSTINLCCFLLFDAQNVGE